MSPPCAGAPALLVTVALALAVTGCPRRARPPPRPSPPARAAVRDAGPPPRPEEAPPLPTPPHAFRLDAAHTGRSGYVLPRHPRVVGRVAAEARISAQAVAVGDAGVVFGSHDGIVYAASLDGGVRWRVATGGRIYTTPLVGFDGTLYLGTDAHRFLAITPRGHVRVALATDDDADTSAALAPDGTLRFASGRTLYSVTPDLTVIFRLDVGGKIFSSPAVAPDGTAVFGSQDDGVYAVGPDGRVRWRFSAGGDVNATPALGPDGSVYVGSDDGNVYALGPDGVARWHRPVGGFVRAGVALGLDRTVIAVTYGPRARVVALDRADGRELWSLPVVGPPTEEYGIASAPLVDRTGAIAVGAPDDALYILDRDGGILARLPLPDDVDSAPVLLADGLLAVGCDDGGLYLVGDGG